MPPGDKENWRTLSTYAREATGLTTGDLVQRKTNIKNESVVNRSKVGIVLSLETANNWISMARVMWSGANDIEEVATIYLQRVDIEKSTA